MESSVLPVYELRTVFHVGTFDPAQRGLRESYEGDSLSVSWCPDAWSSIAHCDGEVHMLRSKVARQFLGMREVTPATMKRILSWAQAEKLIEPVTIYRAWSTDEEGESRYSEHLSRSEAVAEEPTRVTQISGWRGLSNLVRSRGLLNVPIAGEAIDFVVMTYAERCGLDGVWWTERFDPDSLSAPRGAIFQSALRNWEASLSPGYDDERLLNAFPEPRRIKFAMPTQSQSLAVGFG